MSRLCRLSVLAIFAIGLSAVIAQEPAKESPPRPRRAFSGEGSRPVPVFPSARGPEVMPSEAPEGGRFYAPPPRAVSAPSRAVAPSAAEAIPVVKQAAGEAKPGRTVYRLKSVPAHDLAMTLNSALRTQPVRAAAAGTMSVVPDAISNSLIISGPPEAIEEVVRLAEQLDQPAAMVQLEVAIADATGVKPAEGGAKGKLPLFEKPEQMEVLARIRLTTLDNQPAYLQVGREEAQVSGTSTSNFGTSNSIRYVNIGARVKLTPRIAPDGTVSMEVDCSDSRLGPAEEGVVLSTPKQGEPIRARNVETLSVQTTVSIPSGGTVILGGMHRAAKGGKERLLLITPQVLRMDGQKKGR